jgi:hypothetical protein
MNLPAPEVLQGYLKAWAEQYPNVTQAASVLAQGIGVQQGTAHAYIEWRLPRASYEQVHKVMQFINYESEGDPQWL